MGKKNNIIKALCQPLPFLDSSINKLQLIGFTSIYTIFFLFVFVPFNLNDWKENSLGYITIGAIVLLCSQFIVRPIFGFKNLKIYSLLLIFALELLLITFIIYLIYGPSFPTFSAKFNEYLVTLKHTSLTLSIPYFIFIWYLNLRHKMSFYKEAENNKIQALLSPSNELLTITGENNKTILAIKYHQLLYVKSAGNYLELFYLKNDKIAKELVRASLKELEANINYSNVIRVHRSYMINTQHISSYKKTRKGYAILIDSIPDTIIPVSYGFKSVFETAVHKK